MSFAPRSSVLLALAAGCGAPPAPEVRERTALQKEEPKCEITRKTPMFGYADLHAHPAVHLGFGWNGVDGMFHGTPGLKWGDGLSADDLPTCDADNHHEDKFGTKTELRNMVFRAMDTSGGGNHHPDGPLQSEIGWPDARSVTHQQMHVEWIRRAYEGGLRLMVASAVDNQVISQLWNKGTTQALPDPFQGTSEADYDAAVAQLEFIRELVEANADWMVLATDARTAECAIAGNKLVIVLGLELDSLTVDQILALREEYGAVVVNPIHMVNNTFGGTAAYSDVLNASNRTLRGEHLEVRLDDTVRFRFAEPLTLDAGLLPSVGVGDPASCGLGYEACDAVPSSDASRAGVANALGLTEEGEEGILDLWKRGMIVDLAHMSDRAQDRVLSMARARQMPVIDSHTDLRPILTAAHPLPERRPRSVSERSLKQTHAGRIADVGGMIGLGTEGYLSPVHVGRSDGNPLRKFVPGGGPQVVPMESPHLRFAIHTGGIDPDEGSNSDGMRGDSQLEARVKVSGQWLGASMVFDPPDVFGSDTVLPGDWYWARLTLPAGTAPTQISELELRMAQDSEDWEADNWNVDALQVFYVGRTFPSALMAELSTWDESYLHRFTKNPVDSVHSPIWRVPLEVDPERRVIQVDAWTGGDDLRCRSNAELALSFTDGTLWADPLDGRLAGFLGLSNGERFERPVALPPGYEDTDLDQIGLTLQSGPGCDEPFAGQDNWNLDRLLVSSWRDMGRRVLLDRSGGPFHRFTGEDPTLSLVAELDREPSLRSLRTRFVKVVVQTAGDDWDLDFDAALEPGDHATGVIRFGGDTVPFQQLPFALNQGAGWGAGETHWVVVDLGQEVPAIELREVEIDHGPSGDEWWIQSVEVEALGSPMANFAEDYALALSLLGGRGVAIGTDLNGFQPQIPYSEQDPVYPLSVPSSVPSSFGLPSPMVAGVRTFQFGPEGIASYGQLPELLASVGQAQGSANAMLPMFRSARDFVEMWKKVEAAQQ